MTLRQRAHKAHACGELQKAESLYKALLDQKCIPEDVGNLGALLSQQQKLKEAINLYNKYLQKWPNNLQLLSNAANAYLKVGNQRLAIELLNKATLEHPANFSPVLKLSKIFVSNNHTNKSCLLLERFCQNNPNEGLAWLELGVIYWKKNEPEKALQAFENGSKSLPQHPSLIANRLTLLKDLNELTKAEELYQSLSNSLKQAKHIQGAWAAILMKRQHIDEAIEILEPLSKQTTQIASNWINLAACQKALKHNIACQRTLKNGLKYCPNNTTLEEALAQNFAETGHPEKSVSILKRHLKNGDIFNDVQLFNLQFIGSATSLIDPKELAKVAKKMGGESIHPRNEKHVG